jgi:hypothetical protein
MAMEILRDIINLLISAILSIIVAYFTATYAVRREMKHGKARFLEICRRYILNFINAFDIKDPQRRLRADPLTYQFYVSELRKIIKDLDELLRNPYTEHLILRYPNITRVLVRLRRELIELEFRGPPLRSLFLENIKEILDLIDVIRKDLGRSFRSTSFDLEIDNLKQALQDAGLLH